MSDLFIESRNALYKKDWNKLRECYIKSKYNYELVVNFIDVLKNLNEYSSIYLYSELFKDGLFYFENYEDLLLHDILIKGMILYYKETNEYLYEWIISDDIIWFDKVKISDKSNIDLKELKELLKIQEKLKEI